MTKSQKQTFEDELKNDNNLLSEVKLGQEVNHSIKEEILVSDFKQKLAQIHQKNFNKPKNRVINLQNKWYWAAASITLFSGSAYFTMQNKFSQPDYLYKQYYEVWEPALVTRSADNSVQKQIISSFELGNYSKVLKLCERIPANVQNDGKLILLKGCSLMETENYHKAIIEFEKFNTKDYTLYTDAGIWYKALCYIKVNKIEKSKALLEKIIKNNNSYSADAKKLLKKLS